MKRISDEDVRRANARLKGAGLGFAIELRGDRLRLRGVLPPKPGARQRRPYQQRLSLGHLATRGGLKDIEALAGVIYRDLNRETFDWANYGARDQDSELPTTCAEWIDRFEVDYFSSRPRNGKTENAWQRDIRAYFRKLPPDAPLTAELLTSVALEKSKPHTVQRARYCNKFQQLARLANINLDLRRYKKNCKAKPFSADAVPTDEQILEWRSLFKKPGFRYAYELQAVCGLRSHEIWHVKGFEKVQGVWLISIGENTKTGARKAIACPTEWIDEWRTWEGSPPAVRDPDRVAAGEMNRSLGARVAGVWRKVGVPLPYTPYSLRHAWNIRCDYAYGIDPASTAKAAGHDLRTHHQYYSARSDNAALEAFSRAQKNTPRRNLEGVD